MLISSCKTNPNHHPSTSMLGSCRRPWQVLVSNQHAVHYGWTYLRYAHYRVLLSCGDFFFSSDQYLISAYPKCWVLFFVQYITTWWDLLCVLLQLRFNVHRLVIEITESSDLPTDFLFVTTLTRTSVSHPVLPAVKTLPTHVNYLHL